MGTISLNEKSFILAALLAEQRIDGRGLFDMRPPVIGFAREDGAVEVQQGETRILAVASGQLAAPYPDRPNEGSLAIFTEFSPMADPSFEPGRPGELAVELGRIVDRGLRESKAVDTEALCVVAGKAVWAIRLDLHILDNGGNLVDVANVAALAALLSFRRLECGLGGPDGQEVVVYPPEVREPIPLSIHHLPIAVTFAFFGDGELVVVDPGLKEEAIMRGRLTVTANAHGEICAIQKGGGVGVCHSEVMRCLRIATAKAVEVTDMLRKAVDAHEIERTQKKLRRHRKVEVQTDTLVLNQTSTKDVEMLDADGSVLSQEQKLVLTCKEIIKSRGGDESIAELDNELGTSDSEEEDVEVKKAVIGRPKKKTKLESSNQESNRESLPMSQEARQLGLQSSLWNAPALDAADAKAASEVDELLKSISAKASATSVSSKLSDGSVRRGTEAAAAVYAEIDLKQRAHQHSRPLGPVFPILGSAPEGKELASNVAATDVGKKDNKRKKPRGSQNS